MNVVNLSGRLVRNAVVNGPSEKAMAFTMATRYGFNAADNKDRVAYVPCVLFNPDKETIQLFTEKGKGLLVECEGRVANSRFEVNGETRYKTDVIVRNGTLSVVK